ncbi:MAG: hypothetical protein ACYDBJ_15460 [Aggregatilineales bacterium]
MTDLQNEPRPLTATVTPPAETAADQENNLSLATLFQAALAAVTRAMKSDDERISLQAAKIVLDQFRRMNLPLVDQEQVITIAYGESLSDSNRTHASSRPSPGPGVTRPVQGRGVRPALGQDRNRQDRRY